MTDEISFESLAPVVQQPAQQQEASPEISFEALQTPKANNDFVTAEDFLYSLSPANKYTLDYLHGVTKAVGKLNEDKAPTHIKAAGLGETALNMLTGMLSAPLALAAKASGNQLSIQDIRKRLTYEPKTESGAAEAEAAGAVLQPISDVLQVGGKVLSKASSLSPEASQAVVDTIAVLAPMMKGMKGVPTAIENAKMETAFDSLAVRHPEAAQEVATRMKEVDTVTGEKLQGQVDKLKEATPAQAQDVGADGVKVDLATPEIQFSDLMKEDEISFDELTQQATAEDARWAGDNTLHSGIFGGWDITRAKEDIRLAQERGNQAAIDSILARALREVTLSEKSKPGISENNPKYQAALQDLAESLKSAKKNLNDLQEIAGVQNVPYEEVAHALENNASGESAASVEAINRVLQEQAAEQYRYVIKADGTVTPLNGVDAVDYSAKAGETVVQRGIGAEEYSILDRGQRPEVAAQGSVAAAKAQLDQLTAEQSTRNLSKLSDGMSKASLEGYEVLEQPPEELSGVKVGQRSRVLTASEALPAKGLALMRTAKDEWTLFKDKEPLQRYSDQSKAVEDFNAAREVATAEQASFINPQDLRKLPGAQLVEGKLRTYYEQLVRTMAPETLSREARIAGSSMAKVIAEQMMKDTQAGTKSAARRKFWNQRVKDILEFLKKAESGEKLADPLLQKAADFYRQGYKELAEADKAKGIEYEELDNYFPHLFEDSEAVAAFMRKRFGIKFGDPGFTKERTFDLYAQAIKAGFKPRYFNPEDMFLVRQHASNIAAARIDLLEDLRRWGVAQKVMKGESPPPNFLEMPRRAPNGKKYWVHQDADAILQNVWDTKGLWERKGFWGDHYRAAMFLKNNIVPIRLLSLFHAIHVGLLVNNAAALTRAAKSLLSLQLSPKAWAADVFRGVTPFQGAWSTEASQLIAAYKDKVLAESLSSGAKLALQYMNEGAFTPLMPEIYKTGALKSFIDSFQQRSLWAIPKTIPALIQSLQKPMFEIWIPNLKTAAYLRDTAKALQTDPTLLTDPLKRQLALRRISKSVDDRFGEMSHNTLFWNKFVKDVAVLNTLSVGWQYGFLRQFGGGAVEMAQLMQDPRQLVQRAKEGKLDRALYTTFYVGLGLTYTGLASYLMSGQQPSGMDYFYPRTGDQDAQGNPQRVGTPFFTKEFASIYKHIEGEGAASGISDLVTSKASGLIGLATEAVRGVNGLGQEIRDPRADLLNQAGQTAAYLLRDIEPIAQQSIERSASPTAKNIALSAAGMSAAPHYIMDSPTVSAIRQTYMKYYAMKQTPFEKAQYSMDYSRLRKLFEAGESEKFGDLLDKMQDRYELTGVEMRKLEVGIVKRSVESNPEASMFQKFTWQQQKALLDKMTPAEREIFIPLSNKQHLKYQYEAPEEKR